MESLQSVRCRLPLLVVAMLQMMELDAVGREAVGGSINKDGYSGGS
jgi:hypothetical protein